jgi:cardiolipin synthase
MPRQLRRRGVRVAEFLPHHAAVPNPYVNLRNHRKILVIDGGAALHRRHETSAKGVCSGSTRPPRHPTRPPLRAAGPVVAQVFEAGSFDWHSRDR